jgi:hypothetical protein
MTNTINNKKYNQTKEISFLNFELSKKQLSFPTKPVYDQIRSHYLNINNSLVEKMWFLNKVERRQFMLIRLFEKKSLYFD